MGRIKIKPKIYKALYKPPRKEIIEKNFKKDFWYTIVNIKSLLPKYL